MGIPMTKAGFENLQNKVDELRDQIPEVQRSISEAREKGDLKENAEYHAARESFGMLEAKIADLEGRLGQATIVNSNHINKDEILFGAKVKILDLSDDEEEEYALVGDGEADPLNNKILTTSPMGQSMLNKRKGQRFVVDAPAGQMEYEVLEISYEGL
jgi:transcription elongation factor GreA